MLMNPAFRQMRRSRAKQLFRTGCALMALFICTFFTFEVHSQTVVKLMALQPAPLQISLNDQLFFGDAVQYTLGEEAYVSGGTGPFSYEWTQNSAIVSTEASILVTPVQNDVYTITVTDLLECTAEQDIQLKIGTGTNDRFANKVNIYPNPASNYIHITVSGDLPQLEGILINSLGRIVWSGVLSNHSTLPLHYPPGFYLLQLRGEDQIVEKRIILR